MAIYFKSHAGNSGERSERYSRTAGVRVWRQRFLQVLILMHFSLLRFGVKNFERRVGAATTLGATSGRGRAEASSSSVSSEAASSAVVSGTGMVAFLPVGRL